MKKTPEAILRRNMSKYHEEMGNGAMTDEDWQEFKQEFKPFYKAIIKAMREYGQKK